MKRLIAALLAGLTLFALVGCSAGSKTDSAAPKDYSQILHDARTDEENEYDMIFTKGEDGKFTAIDGYSAEYEAGQLDVYKRQPSPFQRLPPRRPSCEPRRRWASSGS